MFISRVAVLVVACRALFPTALHAETNDDVPAGFNRVSEFIQNSLIGKTLESSVETKIDHAEFGPAETEFYRRSTYFNHVPSESGLTFDMLSLIRQSIWPVDAEGNRTGKVEIKNRIIVIRYELKPSKAIDGAIGLSKLLTSSGGVTPGDHEQLRVTCSDGVLSINNLVPLYDGSTGEGKTIAKAYSEATKISIENGKLLAKTQEKDFIVDLETQKQTPGSHDVTLISKEVETLLSSPK